MKAYYFSYTTEFRKLWLAFSDKGLVNITFSSTEVEDTPEDFLAWLNKNFNKIEKYPDNENVYTYALASYLNGKVTNIDIPLHIIGTDFQKKVWKELLNIPYGETRSYKDIAISIGNSKATRAVGMANNRNPLPIVIPCHRVVGSNKSLVGYGGGLDIKVKLLELEGVQVKTFYKGKDKEYKIV